MNILYIEYIENFILQRLNFLPIKDSFPAWTSYFSLDFKCMNTILLLIF